MEKRWSWVWKGEGEGYGEIGVWIKGRERQLKKDVCLFSEVVGFIAASAVLAGHTEKDEGLHCADEARYTCGGLCTERRIIASEIRLSRY